MLRYLTPAESFLVGVRINYLCTVRGGLDEGLLAKAWDVVVTAHPALRARLGRDDLGYYLCLPDAEPLELLVSAAPVGEELDVPIGPDGPLARAVLLRGGEDDTFVLGVAHPIADGRSALELCQAIWRTYTALAEGGELPRAGSGPELPDSCLSGLRHWSAKDVAEHVDRRRARAQEISVRRIPFDGGVDAPMAVERLLIEPERTTRVVSAAKAGDTSVHSLVAAALLLAARAELQPATGPQTLGFVSAVDIRAKLVPPRPPAALGHCASWFVDSVEVRPDSDPLDLARTLRRRLHAGIAQGFPELDMLGIESLIANPGLSTMATVNLSNVGRIAAPALPAGAELTDLQTYVSAARHRWDPEATEGVLPAGMITLDGRLDLSIPYRPACFDPVRIRRILDHVDEVFTKCAR